MSLDLPPLPPPPFLIVGHLKPTTPESRTKLLKALTAAATYAFTHEPLVTKYSILTPLASSPSKRDPGDIYVIEEYQSHEGFQKHCEAPLVRDVISLVTTEGILKGGVAPTFGVPSFANTLTRGQEFKEPFVVWASLDYEKSFIPRAVQGWRAVTENTAKTERDVGVYMCLRDHGKENRVWMLEVYEDEGAFKRHCEGKVVVDAMKGQEGKLEGVPDVVFLKRGAGFLNKVVGSKESKI